MIGEKLDALLKARNIKAATLANMIGINKSTIYSIIKRNNKNVDYSTMEKIADALDVPVEYFRDKDSKIPENEKDQDEITSDSDLEEFIQLFEQLTNEQKRFILSSMKGLLLGR